MDKNLIRGLLKKTIKDFDEDLREKNSNKSLLQRLKNQMSLNSSKVEENKPQLDMTSKELKTLPKNLHKSHNSIISNLEKLAILNTDRIEERRQRYLDKSAELEREEIKEEEVFIIPTHLQQRTDDSLMNPSFEQFGNFKLVNDGHLNRPVNSKEPNTKRSEMRVSDM